MKKLYLLAALLVVNTAAHAGNSISFEIGGHKIHVEAPKDCDSLSCIKVSAPGLSGADFGFKGLKSRRFDDDDAAQRSDPPASKSASAPVAANAPSASTAIASAALAPAIRDDVAAAAPAPSAVSSAAPTPAAIATPARAPATPLGVWVTEQNKGNVRVEPCGKNLCGYAVNTGEKILINMKPSDTKWTGQIYDPDSGRNYGSTIAMKGPNTMRVQGCAFGGFFCGGQTWKRLS